MTTTTSTENMAAAAVRLLRTVYEVRCGHRRVVVRDRALALRLREALRREAPGAEVDLFELRGGAEDAVVDYAAGPDGVLVARRT